MSFDIKQVSRSMEAQIRSKIDNKTKPIGSLGILESIAKQIALIQRNIQPILSNPHIVVFAGDHGIANDGVSAYPQAVTYQMVYNFINGGAGINVFCKQHNIDLKIVDSGVNYDFGNCTSVTNCKVGWGTKSFLHKPAMTHEEFGFCVEKGVNIVSQIFSKDCNIIGFGEMGIGNTSSASLIMSKICSLPIEDCVGKGTGIDDTQLKRKVNLLRRAQSTHSVDPKDSTSVLSTFGGYEIVMMYGAMLKAAELGMTILVDGFIATSAFLAAHAQYEHIKDYAIFSHCSGEQGHKRMLQYLEVDPVLNLKMRLGEGTGCALSYPLIQSALSMMNDMASFENAGVSKNNQ